MNRREALKLAAAAVAVPFVGMPSPNPCAMIDIETNGMTGEVIWLVEGRWCDERRWWVCESLTGDLVAARQSMLRQWSDYFCVSQKYNASPGVDLRIRRAGCKDCEAMLMGAFNRRVGGNLPPFDRMVTFKNNPQAIYFDSISHQLVTRRGVS